MSEEVNYGVSHFEPGDMVYCKSSNNFHEKNYGVGKFYEVIRAKDGTNVILGDLGLQTRGEHATFAKVNIEDAVARTKEAMEVMQAFLDGKRIEYISFFGDGWKDTYNPSWNFNNCKFRVKETKPSINWNEVKKQYKWLYKNSKNELYLCEHRPIIHRDSDFTWTPSGCWTTADGFMSGDPGICDWRNSLVGRPS